MDRQRLGFAIGSDFDRMPKSGWDGIVSQRPEPNPELVVLKQDGAGQPTLASSVSRPWRFRKAPRAIFFSHRCCPSPRQVRAHGKEQRLANHRADGVRFKWLGYEERRLWSFPG